ncbi:unnamed protein product [Nippostrongylus brasiliensis]|uniref:Uncharacterized protein n=1 Tax=Nippostrongylus brasiliensis TaxID=27835 RepID=A0A0N4XX58_NIPBR|nr:unnamed protein product [Nippostrongylus brasiliensis]
MDERCRETAQDGSLGKWFKCLRWFGDRKEWLGGRTKETVILFPITILAATLLKVSPVIEALKPAGLEKLDIRLEEPISMSIERTSP